MFTSFTSFAESVGKLGDQLSLDNLQKPELEGEKALAAAAKARKNAAKSSSAAASVTSSPGSGATNASASRSIEDNDSITMALQKALDEKNEVITRMEEEHRAILEELQGELSLRQSDEQRLTSELSILQEKMHALQKNSISNKEEVVEHGSSGGLGLGSAAEEKNEEKEKENVSTLKRELVIKTTRCTEQEASIAELSEKMRDLMKKLKDAREKVVRLEGGTVSNATQNTEKEKMLKQKESELVALRLRFEAVDSALTDSKDSSSDLTARIAELQTESAAARELCRSLEASAADLRDCKGRSDDQLQELTSQLTAARAALEQEQSARAENEIRLGALLESEKAKASRADKLLQQAALSSQSDKEVALAAVEARLVGVTQENQMLLEKLGSQRDSAEILGDYKKRAQAALKKANESSQSLQKDKDRLLRELAERDALISRMENSKLEEKTQENIFFKDMEKRLAVLSAENTRLSGEKSEICRKEQIARNELAAMELVKTAMQEQLDGALAFQEALTESRLHGVGAAGVGLVVGGGEGVEKVDSASTSASGGGGFENGDEKQSDDSEAAPAGSGTPAPQTQTQRRSADTDTATDTASPVTAVWSVGSSQSPLDLGEGMKLRYGGDHLQHQQQQQQQPHSNLVYVFELQTRLAEALKELKTKDDQVRSFGDDLHAERLLKAQLEERVEELVSFVGRSKSMRDGLGAVDIEYLKNVVFHFMSSTSATDKLRLLPVISTLLKYTSGEKKAITAAIDTVSNGGDGHTGLVAAITKNLFS